MADGHVPGIFSTAPKPTQVHQPVSDDSSSKHTHLALAMPQVRFQIIFLFGHACNAGDPACFLGQEDPLKKGQAKKKKKKEGTGCPLPYSRASLVAQLVKNLPAMWETPQFDSWVRKIPWRRAWQPTPVFLPGESPWTEESGRLKSMGSQRVGHA